MASNGNVVKDSGRFSWMHRKSSSAISVANSDTSSAKTPKQAMVREKLSRDKSSISRPKLKSSAVGSASSRYSAVSVGSSSAGVEPPSASTYAFEAGKQTVEVLQRFTNMLPVPCANEVLEVALILMTAYENVTVLEQRVKDVHNRIGSLMLVMIDGLSGQEATSISPNVVQDIEDLGGYVDCNSLTITAYNIYLLTEISGRFKRT
ncbi:hypothetical protein FRC19_008683 [Serendipita sp. 401]|nr:hypothetical protein FRC19_008683 [Serendipita sp. 401]